MIRVVLTLLVGILSTTSWAVQMIVQDPCSEELWVNESLNTPNGTSVGDVTISALDSKNIPYTGDAGGISSIRGTVIGDKSLEVITDQEMKAYGWCYQLNGIDPDLMPDQVFIQSSNDVIRWYFGYAHYRDGKWISFCSPTSKERPNFICQAN